MMDEFKVKPILFGAEMVRALIDGRKTQTRRVMKLQPEAFGSTGWLYGGGYYADDSQMQSHLFHDVYGEKGSPYGSVYTDGTVDVLWVRETWQAQCQDGRWWHEVPKDERDLHNWAFTNPVAPAFEATPPKWMPSIFMPKMATRLILEVTSIHVERVQDIDVDDIVAEGAFPPDKNIGLGGQFAVEAWWDLWDAINAKRGYSWSSNPWVWVVGFKQINDFPLEQYF